MNYTKPEVAVLGQAVRVIEDRHTKPVSQLADGFNGPKTLSSAYDLDE
jgi:hypothetical protein